MKIGIKYFLAIILTIFFIVPNHVSGQSRKELEKKKSKNQKEIDFTNKLLKKTKKNKTTSLNKLKLLNSKIKARKNLISNINKEISLMDNEIVNKNDLIETFEKELNSIKKNYAKLIYYAYLNSNPYDKMVYIMSAEDVNQAYKRIKYFQYYTKYRRSQADTIKAMQKELENRISVLESKKATKKALMFETEEIKDKLYSEKQEQSSVLSQLKLKEKDLKKKIKAKQLVAHKLQVEIERIIEEEARKAAERARLAAAKANASGNTSFMLTPEDKLISENFGKNKGHLPWPTERGIITGIFGEHPHPVLSGIKIRNNGIDISTTEGSIVRAIFNGTVSKVFVTPDGNQAVIIRHGNYLTVYSNLKEVIVSSGDKVKTKQTIGVISTEKNENSTEVHFEIWKSNTKLNPKYWISKT